jgi:hypothetical protein
MGPRLEGTIGVALTSTPPQLGARAGRRSGRRIRAALPGLGLVVGLAVLLAGPALATAAEVSSFTPQGTARGVRQATARFSDPMVALGDPGGAPDPFTVECPEAGSGRWVDSRTWVHDFARDLPAGLACVFRLRPGVTTLAGEAVAGGDYAFSTGGPAIVSANPADGAEAIDEEQAFVLVLDGAASEASILAHAAFAVEGLPGRVGVRLVEGAARRQVVARALYEPPAGPVVVLQARQRFPAGARVRLVWGRGIGAPGGVATERDQTLGYRVREAFTARFTCERERGQAACLPVTPMVVRFTAPVAWPDARRVALVGPGGARREPEAPRHESALVERLVFRPPFPESTAFRVELPPGLRDDAGRPLANAGRFPLAVATDAYPPLAKFAARFGIVEWTADAALPVTLRNLEPEVQVRLLRVEGAAAGAEAARPGLLGWLRARVWRVPPELPGELQPWLRRIAAADRERSVFQEPLPGAPPRAVALARPHGARPMEVVGIPLGAPGLYVVEIESARLGAALLGKPAPMYVPAAALVTNLGVHLKWGRQRSLVWVTALDSGRPVAGARVTVQDCHGRALWRGETDGAGLAWPGALPPREALPRCPVERAGGAWEHARALAGLDEGLFVVAQTAGDTGFVHSSWDDGIEPWRFRLPEAEDAAGVVAHTVLDRALFRAGETVHMTHVLRRQVMEGFAPVPEAERPTVASIRHLGSQERYELPLAWDGKGIAESRWPIPREARLGRWEIVLRRPPPAPPGGPGPAPAGAPASGTEAASVEGPEWRSGAFRVEEFRVPSMRAVIRGPAEPLVAAEELPLDVAVGYLAGGGARHHPVTLRAVVSPRPPPEIEGLEGFTVANGPLAEGIRRRGVEGDDEGETPPGGVPPAGTVVHQKEALTLDAAGTLRARVRRLPRAATPLDVVAELEFRDPSGEVQTAATTVPLWPARRLVGLRPESWVASRARVAAEVAVVDVGGTPVAGAAARVDLFERRLYSHRKRLVGGFYAYEHVEEVRRLGALCQGVTDARGRLACEGPAPVAGNAVLVASAADEAGRETAAHAEVWVAGSEEWWFEARDADRIDVLPERRRYEPGETARLQVRMPFREATALVTVEREGVIEAAVAPLAGTAPVVELPVLASHAPNVFVSVLAVRGRAGGPAPTALVDLGRPAFKLGVAELRVGWRAHELVVTVAPDREVYRARDTARVRIAVRTADGRRPPPGSEVAVAAVDEGLLDLAPNGSWALLPAMMGRRAYGVRTATAQMHVVGKRHFGLKAVAAGGGGGRQTTRELFDTLLLWKGRVPLDRRGEAVVEVPLSDALTSFRVVAVAQGAPGAFGTGQATIRSTQDLMLLAGLAPLVREGDRVLAEVTVRNTTGRALEADVRARIDGLAGTLPPRALRLAPGEAAPVTWEVTVPAGVTALAWLIEAGEAGGARDRLRATQRVVPAVATRTLAAALLPWPASGQGPIRQPVERPAGALPGRGGVEVSLRPTLADSLGGVREWMARYPYTCLEQRVSQAVALRDERLWGEVLRGLPAHLDGDGLLKYFPRMAAGSDVLTAYVLAVAHEAGWALPEAVQRQAEAGLRQFVAGALRRSSGVGAADRSLRRLAAIEALARHGRAEPGMLGSLAVEPALWPTSALLDWWSVLHRLSGVPGRERRLREVESLVRARLTRAGSVLTFSSERTDRLWWLMTSPDANAGRLILHLLETGAWAGELPELVRGALARQRRGAWDLTVANAWGALALERFSRARERTPVGGVSTVTLGGMVERVEWAGASAGRTLALPWPERGAELAVEHAGPGAPWVLVQARAAVPAARPLASGYRIEKRWEPVEQRRPGQWSRGDVVRVRLEIEAQADMTWVVVDDPVPAGASHLGTGLGGAGRAPAGVVGAGGPGGGAWPAFEERSFEAFRAYYAAVPKGRLVAEYLVRLGQPGRFHLPATRVEALYAPEVFGELPNAPVEVAP